MKTRICLYPDCKTQVRLINFYCESHARDKKMQAIKESNESQKSGISRDDIILLSKAKEKTGYHGALNVWKTMRRIING